MWNFPDQGSNPFAPAVEARSLNYWTTRELLSHLSSVQFSDMNYIHNVVQSSPPSISKALPSLPCEGFIELMVTMLFVAHGLGPTLPA